MPFLKRTSIDSKPFSVHIDFQVTISNWCIDNVPKSFKTNDILLFLLLFFWFFMSLVLILLFQKAQIVIVEEI